MRTLITSFGLLLAGAFLASSANAAIVLTTSSPLSPFAPNSGIQTVDVLFRSNVVGGEFISDISVDFDLSGGALFGAPFAGTFSGVGFLPEIDAGGSSFFDNGGGNASLSIFYNATVPGLNLIQLSQAVPDTDVLFARLNINTTGLAPGLYNITSSSSSVLTSPTAVFASGSLTPATPSFTGGSFEISAIPEPGSFALLAVVSAGVWVQRRRRRAKKSVVVAV